MPTGSSRPSTSSPGRGRRRFGRGGGGTGSAERPCRNGSAVRCSRRSAAAWTSRCSVRRPARHPVLPRSRRPATRAPAPLRERQRKNREVLAVPGASLVTGDLRGRNTDANRGDRDGTDGNGPGDGAGEGRPRRGVRLAGPVVGGGGGAGERGVGRVGTRRGRRGRG